MGVLTLNESAMIAMVMFWLTLGVFTVRQLRPVLVPRLQNVSRILAVLTIVFVAILVVQAADHFPTPLPLWWPTARSYAGGRLRTRKQHSSRAMGLNLLY